MGKFFLILILSIAVGESLFGQDKIILNKTKEPLDLDYNIKIIEVTRDSIFFKHSSIFNNSMKIQSIAIFEVIAYSIGSDIEDKVKNVFVNANDSIRYRIIGGKICKNYNYNIDNQNVIYNPMNRLDITYKFKNGIYLSFEEFKNNKPSIVTNMLVEESGFFGLFSKKNPKIKSISYIDSFGKGRKIEAAKVWGYVKNSKLFILIDELSLKAEKLGAICFFKSEYTVATPSYNYPTGQAYVATRDVIESRLIDFGTGDVLDYTNENLELLIYNDKELLAEFKSKQQEHEKITDVFSKQKQQKFIFMLIQKYNEKHPVFIL